MLLHAGASGNRIGGTVAADRNVISGNDYAGISIHDAGTDNNLVQGNYIGTGASGSGAIGNGTVGVALWAGAKGNQIGGAAPGAGNVIANSSLGVIVDANTADAIDNAILGNRIFSNGSLGIDLFPAGVTANDAGDGDSGPNGFQNYPVLSSAATTGTQVTVTGTLNSTANTQFRIEFFASAVADSSGHGEAERYLGSADVTTNGSGNASINAVLTSVVGVGEIVSATATRTDASFSTFFGTSEFAQNVAAVLANMPPANTVPGSQAVNEDTTQAIAGVSVNDVNGNLSTVQLGVVSGVLNVSLAGGATISAGANGTGTLTLSGTQSPDQHCLGELDLSGQCQLRGWRHAHHTVHGCGWAQR